MLKICLFYLIWLERIWKKKKPKYILINLSVLSFKTDKTKFSSWNDKIHLQQSKHLQTWSFTKDYEKCTCSIYKTHNNNEYIFGHFT